MKENSEVLNAELRVAMKRFVSERWVPNSEMATNEQKTRSYLIGPYLKEVLGVDPSNPREVEIEKPAPPSSYKKAWVDYALLQDGHAWCLIEAKELGRLSTAEPGPGQHRYWAQLSFYADTFKDALYFALTDGHHWQWYKRSDKHLLERKPFLEHDVSKPAELCVPWFRAVRQLYRARGALPALATASLEVTVASTLTRWLDSLRSPSKSTLKQVLKYGGHPQRSLEVAAIRDVWAVVWDGFVRTALAPIVHDTSRDGASTGTGTTGGSTPSANGSEPGEDPGVDTNGKPQNGSSPENGNLPNGEEVLPEPPAGFAWRIGERAKWKASRNGAELMREVIIALSQLHPEGPPAWYRSFMEKRPKWIAVTGSDESKQWRQTKELTHGFSCNTNLTNAAKKRRLQFMVEHIKAETGIDPALELTWPGE